METKSKVQHDKSLKKMSQARRGSNKYKKFVGNLAEGQGFADKRKKKIKQEYYKMLQKEKRKGISQPQRVFPPRMDEDEIEEEGMMFRSSAPQTTQEGECSNQRHNVEESYRTDLRFNRREEESNLNNQNSDRRNRKESHRKFKKDGKNTFSKAMHEAQLRKEEAQKRREQKKKEKEEKETALQNYRKKKKDNYYKFHCKKTKKGQPVMKYQMEFLLQKIEKQKERENNAN